MSSATASATASGELLYAVLESHVNSQQGLPLYNTVAIAGVDGYARAKTTFTSLTPPYVGCMGPIFPPQAHTAAGKVFFIDGNGVVRSLGVDRSIREVAKFPLGAQQEASFAVSPDGKHLLATVLTIPPKPSTSNPCQVQGTGFAPGDWAEDIYAADAGGSAKLISHRTWPQSQPDNVLSLVAWNSEGPLATFPSGFGTQGGGPVREGWYGPVVRLDPNTGSIVQRLGSDSCYVTDVAWNGTYVCADMNGISVFNPEGSLAWKYSAPNQGFMVPMLSPDTRHVAALGPIVVGNDGSSAALGDGQPGSGFFCQGWLDSQTMIGWSWTSAATHNRMAIVRLSAPSNIADLGFAGTFVGVVQNA